MPENQNGFTLLRSEDWMAVWLGFLVIAAVLVGVRPSLPKYSWSTGGEFAATVAENRPAVDKLIKEAEAKGEANLAASAAALATAMDGHEHDANGGDDQERDADYDRVPEVFCAGSDIGSALIAEHRSCF
jgi:hypothetical protein